MERPILNPMLADPEAPAPRATPWRATATRLWLRNAGRMLWRILTYSPLRNGPLRIRIEDGTFWQRVLRGAMYRLTFVPLLVALSAVALVYSATHPPVPAPTMDPSAHHIYYDPVTLLSSDGVRLDGWLVPVIDAKTVLAHKEQSLRARRPAVVLLHDHGRSRQQMLPLIQPLHEAGFVVLAIDLRGRGGGVAPVGATYGLREANDVKAAVELLRRRPYVDATKIALVGIGTGGNAAILAAHADPAIAAVVAVNPIESPKQVLTEHLGPKQAWLSFINPLCRWTFELAYQAELEDLNLRRYEKMMEARPVMVHRAGQINELGAKHAELVTVFLDEKISAAGATAGLNAGDAPRR